MNTQDLIDEFAPRAREPFDLCRQSDLDLARTLAERLEREHPEVEALAALEHRLASERDRVPLALHLAVKLARSRRLVASLPEAPHLSVVFAVYKETERLETPAQHPHGEDFLNRKLEQLEWLLDGVPGASFELVVVDDGCPDRSGEAVRARALELGQRGSRVRVLELAEAIRAGHPATRGLASADDSRKGGSIQLGLWECAEAATERAHVVLYTDADLSTHLGQSGLLIAPILAGSRAAIGSRRHADSVVIKGGARNDRGKLFIYLWKGMLAPLAGITDTQCGFKAFRAEGLRALLEDSIERQFAFDIELLLRCELASPGSIERAPVAWFDSEALSTTTDLAPYLAMLQQVAAMYRRYLPATPGADEVAALVESLDEARFEALLERIPRAITERDPREFGSWRGVSIDELTRSA